MGEPESLNIAIHPRPESFSDRWIEYCRAHRIPHRLVDCYRNDILEQVKGCDGLMWHWDQKDYMAVLFCETIDVLSGIRRLQGLSRRPNLLAFR